MDCPAFPLALTALSFLVGLLAPAISARYNLRIDRREPPGGPMLMQISETQLDTITQLLGEGMRAGTAGDVRMAESCYDRCIAFDDGTEPTPEEAVALRPLWFAYVECAALLESQGDYEGAIRRARRALVGQSTKAWALDRLAACYRALGRLAEAENACREAIAATNPPVAWRYILLCGAIAGCDPSRIDECREVLERAIGMDPNLEDAHYNLGILALKQDDLDSARLHLERAIALAPDYAEAHCKLGVVFLRQNNLETAHFHLEKAVALDPKLGDAYGELGQVLIRELYRDDQASDLGRVQACEDVLRKAIVLVPDDPVPACYLVNLYWKCGRLRQAEEEGEGLIKRFPLSSVAHLLYGDFLASTDRGQKKAERLLKKAVELGDEDAQARFHYGKALLLWGRWQEAAAMLRESDRLGEERAIPLLRSYVPHDDTSLDQ
ncbi:MAG: tetratricopeptide repeat protein [Thermoguttaceae bacterium]